MNRVPNKIEGSSPVAPSSLAAIVADLSAHKEEDRALRVEVDGIRADMGHMETRLNTRIDSLANTLKPQVDALILDKERAMERVKVYAEVALRDEARRKPNPWLLGAWQGCAALLFGAILAWLARDHIQGGVGAVPQYTTSVITTAPAPGRHP